jgi:hypothetical protein
MTLVDGIDRDRVDLADVEIRLEPPGPTSVRKLESLLEDVTLARSSDGWWRPDHPLPPEADAAVSRIALALALRESPGREARGLGPDHDLSWVRLFDGRPSFGLSRITSKGGAVTVETVSLAPSGGAGLLAFGRVSGRRTNEGFRLDGTRRILGRGTEEIRLEARLREEPVTAQGGGPDDG